MVYREYRLAKYLNSYGYIMEVVIGSVANILVLIVMLGLRHLPICNYMAALALADLSVILGPCLTRWLHTENIDARSTNTAVCRILSFQSYWSFGLSAWLLVAMTIDRYIAITFPLKAIRLSTPYRARVVILILMTVMAIINFHFLLTLTAEKQPGNKQQTCNSYDQFKHFVNNIWPWIDATVYSFLPFTFLIIFNILIIHGHRKSTILNSILKGSTAREMPETANKVSRRMTVTLLTVTISFIALTAPTQILFIIRQSAFNFKPTPTTVNYKILAQYSLTAGLVNILLYANHCVNFFFYVLTGHKFRQQLFSLFKLQRKQQITSIQTVHMECGSTETNISNLRGSKSCIIQFAHNKENVWQKENSLSVQQPNLQQIQP